MRIKLLEAFKIDMDSKSQQTLPSRSSLVLAGLLFFLGNMFTGDVLGLISVPQMMMSEGSWVLNCLVFILFGVLATLEHLTTQGPKDPGRKNKPPLLLLGVIGVGSVVTIKIYNTAFEYVYFPEPPLNLFIPIVALGISKLWNFEEQRKTTRLEICSYLLIAVGLAMLTFPGRQLMTYGESPGSGTALSLVASFGIAVIAKLQEISMAKYNLSPAEIISHSALFSAFAILIGLVISGKLLTSLDILAFQDSQDRPAGVFWVATIGYCVTRVYFSVLGSHGVAISLTCAAASESIFKVLVKVFLLAEPLLFRYIWSAVMVFVGLLMATKTQTTVHNGRHQTNKMP